MICKVYDYCPIQKNCENCPQWYKSYVKTCKEAGKEPTDMRPKQFHSYDVTPVKGEDMTWEETGYSSFYPQYRCKFCIEKNKEKEKILKKIEKLEQEVKELKKNEQI